MPKILFIRGGAVGDFILTLPAIKLAHDHFPDSEIHILGYPSIAELAKTIGLAHEIRSIEHSTLAPFFAPNALLDPETCAYFQEFDVVISYLYDPDEIFAGNLARAGVETLFCGPFRIDESNPPIHAAEQLCKPLESLALYPEQLWIEHQYQTPSVSLPTPAGTSNATPNKWIAIHPGSGSPSKNWSFESWCEILFFLHQHDNNSTSFLVISGEAEHHVIQEFLEMLRHRSLPHSHLESLPLSELAGHIQQASFFLGHDSGISHLAATCGIPGLSLFGPTRPDVWAPAHPKIQVIASENRSSLGEISPEIVKEHLQRELFTAV